jgi:hypothetical protein
MRDEPATAFADERAASASSPAARTLGALCLGGAVLALLASRAQRPLAASRRHFVATSPKTVIPAHRSERLPAQAGTHAEHAERRCPHFDPLPQNVIPAHAGTHAEPLATRPFSGTATDPSSYGPPPAGGRRAWAGGQVDETAKSLSQQGSRRPPGRPVEVDGLYQGAALLALSVLLDSAVEHSRGKFENPGMFAPLVTSLATTLAATRTGVTPVHASRAVYTTALAMGAAGTAFHVYNVSRRPGGFCWQNLFYAAPLGAPAALGLAGALGLAANRLAQRPAAPLFGLPAGRALCALAGIGMAGSAAEAGLLHFRGAYHRPAMWLPVTVPPVASIFLLRAAAGARDRFARAWLGLTALLGVAGVAFHANGVARQMGGWNNWRQNLLSGPPLPAPPSFLALALAGRAAIAR